MEVKDTVKLLESFFETKSAYWLVNSWISFILM